MLSRVPPLLRRGVRAPPAAGVRRHASQAPKTKHALLYSEIFPPVLKVLGYSTATYFALQLLWVHLRNQEEAAAQASELDGLKAEIRELSGASTERRAV